MSDTAPPAAPLPLPFVRLFTDGACSGNPGPGGWGFILRHPATGKTIERSGGEAESTNNRMELMALIAGLEALNRRTDVEVITDSAYVADGCAKWLPGWKRNGFMRRDGRQLKPVKNRDLWERLDALLAKHQVRFTQVRGHTGHPENERCDELAVAASKMFTA
jgi:ribonuclease HI